jgi:alkaline phosphatase D
MADLILGPIVGGLTDTQAYIWGRTDTPAILHVWLGYKPDLSDAWHAGESYPLSADIGFAGVVPLSGLTPETRYYYTLADNAQNPLITTSQYFTTFPSAGERRDFSFAFGSCFLPKGEKAGKAFQALESLRTLNASDSKFALRFGLLIGDQIYADDYKFNGLDNRAAITLKDYRQVYAYTWSNPHFSKLLANLPAFMTLDDHEVDDDWTWVDFERSKATIPPWDRFFRWLSGRPKAERQITKERVCDALQAYWEHQGMHAREYVSHLNIDSNGRYTLASDDLGSLAYKFNYGAAAFFVLDTRSMRVKKSRKERTMFGEGQWAALEKWLQEVKDSPVKFIVTSCALLFRMWVDIPRDRWTGFPEERARLLDLLIKYKARNVYLLAGDLHSAHAVSADLQQLDGSLIPLWEFCSTAFEQKPNTIARFTYMPYLKGPLKNQCRRFTYSQNNFGVVRVEFTQPNETKVRFEIYDADGKLLDSVEAIG